MKRILNSVIVKVIAVVVLPLLCVFLPVPVFVNQLEEEFRQQQQDSHRFMALSALQRYRDGLAEAVAPFLREEATTDALSNLVDDEDDTAWREILISVSFRLNSSYRLERALTYDIEGDEEPLLDLELVQGVGVSQGDLQGLQEALAATRDDEQPRFVALALPRAERAYLAALLPSEDSDGETAFVHVFLSNMQAVVDAHAKTVDAPVAVVLAGAVSLASGGAAGGSSPGSATGSSDVHRYDFDMAPEELGFGEVLTVSVEIDNTELHATVVGVAQTLYQLLGAAVIAIVLVVSFALWILMKPLNLFVKAAAEIASGNLEFQVPQGGSSEFASLRDEFNVMARSLKQSAEKIAAQNEKIQLILDSVSDGLLLIDSEFKVQPGFSKASTRLLAEPELEGKHFLDTLFRSSAPDAPERKKFEDALTTCFLLFMPDQFGDVIRVLPQAVTFSDGERMLSYGLNFFPVEKDDAIVAIVVLVRDETELKEMRERLADESIGFARQIAELSSLAVQPESSEQFFEYCETTSAELRDIKALGRESVKADIAVLFRRLHTHKGNARLLGFDLVQNLVHEAENVVSRMRDGVEVSDDEFSFFQGRVEAAEEILTSILGLRGQGGVTESGSSAEAKWQARLKVLVQSCQKMAADLGKKVAVLADLKDTPPAGSLAQVQDCLVHLTRNSLDHGIESSEARVSSGKPGQAALKVTISRGQSGLWLCDIVDDGGGINTAAVVQKAVDSGVLDAAPEVISLDLVCDLICRPGLSTSEKVTDLSGRGVGMNAVRETARELGGDLTLERTDGKGTHFCFSWKDDENSAGQTAA